ncbi:uncharacterized protein B0T23DRAFT_386213 [Neurospora hispaniola]|uniref:AN1-type domain-containing protein n=1 Tax=Neurospora hispaniola TaxID=588809 RepID=A0AAJ0I1E4_9PEZI|nr:hypothetical protein B0T23DRAFT_386213 [Neurospora hispaniola]
MSNNDSSDTSYVKMSTADVASPSSGTSAGTDASLVGKHCQLEYCNQLDFLPFLCQSCHKTFCLDHRSESSHNCACAGAWAERRRLAQLARPSAGEGKRMRELVSQKPCADDACKTIIGTSLVPGVHCPSCNRDYCLKHRLAEDHDCKSKVPIGARAASAATAAAMQASAKSALERFKLWGKTKREEAARSLPKPKPSTAAQRVIAKRIYLYVEAESETAKAKIPKGEFFYNKEWVVGRVLDAAARSLQVQNINNQSSKEEDRLRVFHVEGGRMLEFNEKIEKVLVNGNTIVLLRGVGPPPDLIEM